MEVERSSTPNTRTPLLTTAPLVRRCSQRFCPNIINDSFKTICDQCNLANPLRKNFLGSIGGKVTKVKLPTSVFSQVREDAPILSSGTRTSSAELERKNMRRKRPHMTVSHSPMAEPEVYNHFNSRGEIIPSHSSSANTTGNDSGGSRPRCNCSSQSSQIGERCMICRPTSTFDINPIAMTPKIFGLDKSISVPMPNTPFSTFRPNPQAPSASKDILPIHFDVNRMDVDAEGDPDLDDFDFSYPDPSVFKPPIHESYDTFGSDGWMPRDHSGNLQPGRPHAQPEVTAQPPRRASSHSSNNTSSSKVGSVPTKRQKLSHLEAENASSSSSGVKVSTRSSQPTNAATEPKTDRSTVNSPRSLKLCSTSDCTGIVSSGSSATRCLSCVRRDWKMKRELASAKPNSSVTSFKDPHGRVTGNVKKKGVTWADDVHSHSNSCTIPNTSPSPKLKIKLKGKSTPSKDLEFKQEEAHLENSAESVVSTPAAEGSRPLVESVETTEKECSKALLPTLPGMVESSFSAVPPTATTEDSLNNVEDAVAKEEHISGWDSDLSDISDSPVAESETGSPSKEKAKSSQPSGPSGLKIRIPARPAGTTYNVKCASQKCDQVLAIGYRWKSCVLCRARRRDFHRKKHSIGTRHQGLLEELTEDENMGTPLSMDLHKHTGQVKLLPGARLCAVKNCTYIIPPVDEYSGKVCTFCLLRRTEREHLEKETGQRPSRRSKLVSSPSFWLQQLDHDRTDRRDGDGRCRRYGCGVLLSISPSRECKQCVARRHWLTNRFQPNQPRPEGPVLLHRGSKKPLQRPRGPAPYPKYKCFSAALVEFKGRLAGFLRAQSIFFLFHQPRSANALFAFDGEYSVVAFDYDIDKRRDEVDANVLKLKKEIEYVGRIKFSPKRLVSILEGGGIAVRFSSMYPVPVLQPNIKDGQTTISSSAKVMQCELEIAVIPDHSHHFIPGQRTIIRFRLYG